MFIDSTAKLVRTARNGRSQKDFAALLGVKQYSISRYESGKVSPPASVIDRCLYIMHTRENIEVPTAEDLANRVRVELANPRLAHARLAFAKLIDVFIDEPA